MPPSEYGKEALETGVVLQPYEIQAVLGVGGFGITYLAKDRNLKQLIALKEYFPNEVARRLPDNRVVVRAEGMKKHFDWGKSRFLLEAQILAQFRHPNIVRVLTLFEANETAYMAMDFEKGRNLAEILDQRRTLEERELKAIVLPLLSGLEELHGQGFIHRDIKPENIVIRDDGTPVLIDFGAARNAMGNRSRALTTLLTPGYSPLEQYYSTADDQGPWTDIYAFGGVFVPRHNRRSALRIRVAHQFGPERAERSPDARGHHWVGALFAAVSPGRGQGAVGFGKGQAANRGPMAGHAARRGGHATGGRNAAPGKRRKTAAGRHALQRDGAPDHGAVFAVHRRGRAAAHDGKCAS